MRDTYGTKNNNLIDNGYWLRKTVYPNNIPADCILPYQRLLNSAIGYYKEIINLMLETYGSPMQLPIDTTIFEHFFDGIEFVYIPFDGWLENGKTANGHWSQAAENPQKILIHYNSRMPIGNQNQSKMHELFHFAQAVDIRYRKFMDALICGTSLPDEVVAKIFERSAEKAAVMYLMPQVYFVKKYKQIVAEQASEAFGIAQLKTLADAFAVSKESAKYRLQECGIYVPAYA